MSSMTDAVFILDRTRRIIEYNDAFATYYRFKSKADCPSTFAKFPEIIETLASDGSPLPLEAWATVRALGGEQVTNAEYVVRRKDTGEVWTGSYNFSPIRDSVGQIVGCVVVAKDITEQKRTEAALRESEEQLRAVVDSAPDAIFIQTGGSFSYLNPAALRLFGAEHPSSLIGKPVIDIFHPDYRAKAGARIQRLNVARESVEAVDEVCLTLGGQSRDVNVSAVPFRYNGQEGALIFARDITARKRADAEHEQVQAQLLHAQRMESVGRLAGGIAHDFNNILSVILNYANFVIEGGAPEGTQEDLLQIKDAARRASALTRQLLAFSRRQILKSEVLQLNDVISNLANMLQRIIGEDITLTLNLEPSLKTARLDPGQVEQVLMNFATNARDAMPSGGELKIETSNFEVNDLTRAMWKEAASGPHILLNVSDTGCGIDEAVRAHIFEPFYTTKPVGQGTGLGLSTVYGIVKQSGGLIAVDSTLGSGTTFSILIAAARREATPYTTAFPNRVTLDGSETVLVVEDEKNVRNMIRRMLKSAGYNVIVAESGEEALRVCKECPDRIDILLTDVVMPNMDGRELKACVQSLRPETKTLFMSGYTGEAIAQHGVEDCGTEFIAKPFDATELKTKIRALLDRRPNPATRPA